MATLTLKNIKKIYPFSGDDEKKAKKKKKKNDDEPVKEKANLQITDKGVVAVQEFNLDMPILTFAALSICFSSWWMPVFVNNHRRRSENKFVGKYFLSRYMATEDLCCNVSAEENNLTNYS